MSISELLVPNNFNLYANSLTNSEVLSAYGSTTQNLNITGASTKVNFDATNISNPHYNTTTSTYTVPANGNYKIEAEVNFNLSTSNAVGNNAWTARGNIFKNGISIVQNTVGDLYSGGSLSNPYTVNLLGFLPLVAGDLITISMDIPTQSGGTVVNSYQTIANATILTIQKE